jgi:outer membrane protein TolC
VGAGGALYDAGRSRHELRRAEEALSASQLAVDLLGKQIRLQVRQAVEALQLRQAELRESRAALARAQEEEKNASRAYEQELLTREQWGLSRIVVLRQGLSLLEREYCFELALHELESLAGFP